MGWDFHHEIAPYDRKEICRRQISNRYEVVKDALVGTTYYAALRSKETGEVHALVILTRIHPHEYCNFGMKWVDETMGPTQCDCPESILKLLSPTDSKYALEWREACRQTRREKKEKPLLKAPIGSRLRVTLHNGETREVIKRAPAYQFKSWWLSVVGAMSYVPRNRVQSAEII